MGIVKYTGQINDVGTGLYLYNARYYDPALGRFTQADTIVPQTPLIVSSLVTLRLWMTQ
jgi:RHS repeat-associated protein